MSLNPTVAEGGAHPGWGTQNAIVRFGLDYIELLGIRDDLERLSAVQPEVRLAVRTGISAGEPVDTGNDLFGLAVVVAAQAAIGAAATAEPTWPVAPVTKTLIWTSSGSRPG